MKKLGVTVVLGGILLGTLAAHAAPSTPSPTPSIVRVNPPIVALGTVTAEVMPSIANDCGKAQKVRLKLVNTTKQNWSGMINFVPNLKPVSLGAAGSSNATQIVDVEGNVLDCTKPLPTQNLRVWKTGAETTPIFLKMLKPKTVSGLVGHNMPSDMSRPWIRRAEFLATCDGPVNAKVHVQGGAQEEKVEAKLAFGIYVSSPTVVVPPNTPTLVPAVVPKPLDCSAPIPTFDYGLVNPAGTPGQVQTKQVMFE